MSQHNQEQMKIQRVRSNIVLGATSLSSFQSRSSNVAYEKFCLVLGAMYLIFAQSS